MNTTAPSVNDIWERADSRRLVVERTCPIASPNGNSQVIYALYIRTPLCLRWSEQWVYLRKVSCKLSTWMRWAGRATLIKRGME